MADATVTLNAVEFVDNGMAISLAPSNASKIALTMTGGQITGQQPGRRRDRGRHCRDGEVPWREGDGAGELGIRPLSDKWSRGGSRNRRRSREQRHHGHQHAQPSQWRERHGQRRDGKLVQAAGNTFDPVQGADAMGRYAAVGPGAKLDYTSGSGRTSSSRLACSASQRIPEAPSQRIAAPSWQPIQLGSVYDLEQPPGDAGRRKEHRRRLPPIPGE